MTQLQIIAAQLARHYVHRSQLQIDRTFAKRHIAEVELHILRDGVEGKNEEIRKLARANMLLVDEEWRSLDKALYDNEVALLRVDAEVAALEAERRALEWSIRARLVPVTIGNDYDPTTDLAFDESLVNRLTDAPFGYEVEQAQPA